VDAVAGFLDESPEPEVTEDESVPVEPFEPELSDELLDSDEEDLDELPEPELLLPRASFL
jgi:hypothetical protein